MEVPVINRLSNFDAGHVSPSLISAVGALQAQSLLKWSAFIIALVASLGTIITRIRVIILRLQCHYCKTPDSSSSSEPLLNGDDFSDCSDDENDDEIEIDEDDAVSWSSISEEGDREEDFHVRGSGFYAEGQNCNLGIRQRRAFSWSDFSSGKSVVKLWDSFGLAYEDEEEDDDDLGASTGRVGLGAWDTRVGDKIPAILAEWGPQFGKIVGGGFDERKVYVRDDVSGHVAVGDLRRFDSPYGVGELGCDSAVTRCCDALKAYML